MSRIRTLVKPRELEQAVRAIADEYPEAIYRAPEDGPCSYVEGRVKNGPDTPGCIFGQVLPIPGEGFAGSVLGLFLTEDALFQFTKKPSKRRQAWLGLVQGLQDGGLKWGDAVIVADWGVENFLPELDNGTVDPNEVVRAMVETTGAKFDYEAEVLDLIPA